MQHSPQLSPWRAARFCASQSSVHGGALTLATAGVLASFLLRTRDSFGNLRLVPAEAHELHFMLLPLASCLSQESQPLPRDRHWATAREEVSETAFNVNYVSQGQYRVSFMATASGAYYVIAWSALSAGGLVGTYFENTDLSDHATSANGSTASAAAFTRLDSAIDFSWRRSERPCGQAKDIGKDIGPDYFSVRWRGLVRLPHSGTFTFFLSFPSGNHVKISVNGLRIIYTGPECGSSASSSSSSTSTCMAGLGGTGESSVVAGTVALMQEQAYPITLEYRHYTTAGPLQLTWQHQAVSSNEPTRPQVVASSRLLTWTTPANFCRADRRMVVKAARACAALSFLAAGHLSLATAGSSVELILQARDEFANLLSRPGLESRFHVQFIPVSKSGRRTLHAIPQPLSSHCLTGGLSATYYALDSGSREFARAQPLWTCEETVDFSLAAASVDGAARTDMLSATRSRRQLGDAGAGHYSVAADSGYSVRWTGSVSVSRTGMYSFVAALTTSSVAGSMSRQSGEEVKLWVDGNLVLEMSAARTFNSRYSVTCFTGTNVQILTLSARLSIELRHTLPVTFPITLEYASRFAQNSSGVRLLWNPPQEPSADTANSSKLSAFEAIPASQLHPLSGLHGARLLPAEAGVYSTQAGLAGAGGLDATFYSDDDLQQPAVSALSQPPHLNLYDGKLPAWVRDASENGNQDEWVRVQVLILLALL